MANVTVAERLNAPAGKVWDLVGGFDSIHKWLPGVKSVTMKSAKVRELVLDGGSTVTEELLGESAMPRSYTYSIVAGMPVTGHVSTLMVVEEGPEASTISWVCTYSVKGAPEAEVRKSIGDFYRAGIANLKKKFK